MDCNCSQTDKDWQIASQKHENDVKLTDCRFNKTGKISCIPLLLDLNLILVASNDQINPDVSQCRKKRPMTVRWIQKPSEYLAVATTPSKTETHCTAILRLSQQQHVCGSQVPDI